MTDSHWLNQIPADRPTMIVADGLFAWFSEGETRSLLNRLTDHFHSGEMALNEYGRPGRLEAWVARHYGPPMLRAAVSASPYVGFDDPHLTRALELSPDAGRAGKHHARRSGGPRSSRYSDLLVRGV